MPWRSRFSSLLVPPVASMQGADAEGQQSGLPHVPDGYADLSRTYRRNLKFSRPLRAREAHASIDQGCLSLRARRATAHDLNHSLLIDFESRRDNTVIREV